MFQFDYKKQLILHKKVRFCRPKQTLICLNFDLRNSWNIKYKLVESKRVANSSSFCSHCRHCHGLLFTLTNLIIKPIQSWREWINYKSPWQTDSGGKTNPTHQHMSLLITSHLLSQKEHLSYFRDCQLEQITKADVLLTPKHDESRQFWKHLLKWYRLWSDCAWPILLHFVTMYCGATT